MYRLISILIAFLIAITIFAFTPKHEALGEESGDKIHMIGTYHAFGKDKMMFLVIQTNKKINATIATNDKYNINKVYFINLDESNLQELKQLIDKSIEKIKELK